MYHRVQPGANVVVWVDWNSRCRGQSQTFGVAGLTLIHFKYVQECIDFVRARSADLTVHAVITSWMIPRDVDPMIADELKNGLQMINEIQQCLDDTQHNTLYFGFGRSMTQNQCDPFGAKLLEGHDFAEFYQVTEHVITATKRCQRILQRGDRMALEAQEYIRRHTLFDQELANLIQHRLSLVEAEQAVGRDNLVHTENQDKVNFTKMARAIGIIVNVSPGAEEIMLGHNSMHTQNLTQVPACTESVCTCTLL